MSDKPAFLSKTLAKKLLKQGERQILEMPDIVGTGIVKGEGSGQYLIGIYTQASDLISAEKEAVRIFKESTGEDAIPIRMLQTGGLKPGGG